MAIDLNKDHYNNSGDYVFQPRTVYPENNADEEIYPQREIYPRQKQPYIKQTFEEKPPQNISEARPTVRVQYPAAPENSPPAAKGQKKGSPAVNILAFFLGGLIALAVLLCMGAVLSAVSEGETAAVSETAPPAEVYEPETYTEEFFSSADVNQINIKGAFSEIKICVNVKVYVKMLENDIDSAVSLEDGMLTVTGSADDHGKFYLYIPADYKGPITVEAAEESDIYCSAGKNIKINADTGHIHISDIKDADVEVTANSANIGLDSCELNSCDLQTYDGSLNVERTSVSEKCALSTGNGEIRLYYSIFFSGVQANADNGYVDITNTNFSDVSSISSTNGGVKASNFNFEDLDISCRNGILDIQTRAKVSKYTVVTNEMNSSVEILPEMPSAVGRRALNLELMNTHGSIQFKSEEE